MIEQLISLEETSYISNRDGNNNLLSICLCGSLCRLIFVPDTTHITPDPWQNQ